MNSRSAEGGPLHLPASSPPHEPTKATAAVLLSNYGGPEGPADCEPYLRNIFMDADLIPIPSLVRPLVARFAAKRRAPLLRHTYEAMGCYSPILEQTRAQADALQQALGGGFRCYVGMRYFRPFIADACREIAANGHEKIIHLPLYPHECRSTTGSSLKEAARALKRIGWNGAQAEVRSFWERPEYLDALEGSVREAVEGSPREAALLFAAHGLPKSVAKGDPYKSAVEATARAVSKKLGRELRLSEEARESAGAPAALAWQSKVGPMRWLEPSVESVIRAYAQGKVRHVIVVPLSFVSEHSETLYELDILYRALSVNLGVGFTRVPTLQTHPGLIAALAEAVKRADGAER